MQVRQWGVGKKDRVGANMNSGESLLHDTIPLFELKKYFASITKLHYICPLAIRNLRIKILYVLLTMWFDLMIESLRFLYEIYRRSEFFITESKLRMALINSFPRKISHQNIKIYNDSEKNQKLFRFRVNYCRSHRQFLIIDILQK